MKNSIIFSSWLFAFLFLLIPNLLQADYIKIYEHKNFQGNYHYVNIDNNIVDGQLYSLQGTNVHDDMSSIKWQLSSGRKVTLYEHSNGTGRKYIISGTGSDHDTHNENFKDCASSWRLESAPSIPLAFSQTSINGVTYKFSKNGFVFPSGGHLQGIQQLNNNHLVISGSSDKYAYFFIVKWNSTIRTSEIGKVIKIVRINDDFRGMRHNHASGIQLAGNILVVGVESGKDQGSSIVFYDLSNVYNPQKVGNKIDRPVKTAGAVGIVKQNSNYLLAVAGWDANTVDFYTSNNTNLGSTSCVFGAPTEWTKSGMSTTGWIDNNWGKYQGVNLIREPNGKLYLVGFNRNGSFEDWADLYSINLNTSTKYMLKKIDKKHVYCQNGASFRYSGGLYAPSPTSKITLWTTERDLHNYTTINKF